MEELIETEPYSERVDDIPLLYGLLKEMGICEILDKAIPRHGNWQGLSAGMVISIWIIHILSKQNHCMEPVESWVSKHLFTLSHLSGERVRALDFSDDRLALCLHALSKTSVWRVIEQELGQRLIRVYKLKSKQIRLDATVGTVSHNPLEHSLFKVGKSKSGSYETQFKLMLASLDPLGLTLAVDVVPGNKADDPLYIPIYERVKTILKVAGLLIIGDSKMSALGTRSAIVAGQDYYLTPLAWLKEDPTLLESYLEQWQEKGEEMTSVFLPQDMPTDGSEPDPNLAIAQGFELSRPQKCEIDGQTTKWQERLLVVRSHSYTQSMQQGFHNRLDKAETALRALTPARGPGKKQIDNEVGLLSGIEKIEKRYHVQGFFEYDYECEINERQIRAYKGNPARVERKVRYQLTVTRNDSLISQAEDKLGWRIYGTNTPQPDLSLTQAVLAYRDQYIEENIFRRLQGKFLSITPVYLQRDDHAKGLFHLLTLGARLLALGDYQAKKALAIDNEQLTGIYKGNANRGTATPTTERMLDAFEDVTLIILPTPITNATQNICFLTPLSPVQERILTLLGLPTSLYTSLRTGVQLLANQPMPTMDFNDTLEVLNSDKIGQLV